MIYIPAIGENDDVLSFEVQVSLLESDHANTIVTGLIDDVILEGVSLALTILKTKREYNEFLIDKRVHVHYCDYSFKKEGSSSMLATYIALFLAINKICINKKILVTGEIDLYGYIHAVGGIREKYEYFKSNNFDLFIVPKITETISINDNRIKIFENISDINIIL
jgi:ATP-dependent Lon protease